MILNSNTVSKDEFDMLWTELEHYRQMTADLERTVDDKDREIRRLTRLLAEEQNDKQEYRTRLSTQLDDESSLREQVATQCEEIKRLKEIKRNLEDSRDQIESAHRTDEFLVKKLEHERDAALDRAIVAETQLEEVEESRRDLRKELSRLKTALEDAQHRQQQQQQVSKPASEVEKLNKVRDEALRAAMASIAERVRSLADHCRRAQAAQGNERESIRMPTTAACSSDVVSRATPAPVEKDVAPTDVSSTPTAGIHVGVESREAVAPPASASVYEEW